MAPPTRELMPATRALLAPAFETYRLRPLDPDTDVRAHLLPGSGATQSRVALSAHLGFKEVRSRIAHNHLDTAGSRGVYVDAEWNVVGFELDVSGGWSLPEGIGSKLMAGQPRTDIHDARGAPRPSRRGRADRVPARACTDAHPLGHRIWYRLGIRPGRLGPRIGIRILRQRGSAVRRRVRLHRLPVPAMCGACGEQCRTPPHRARPLYFW